MKKILPVINRSLSLPVIVLSCLLILEQSFAESIQPVRPDKQAAQVVSGKNGLVVSQTPIATEIGRDTLEQGGNAVDAAIATAFALAVTWPEAGNIAGGGFMMVAPIEGEVVCIEYREKAPATVNKNSFIGWKEMYHPRMTGVPGTVHGMYTAHQKFGRLPWNSLVLPAVEIAKNGFLVDDQLAFSLNLVLSQKSIQTEKHHAEFFRVFRHPDGRPWKAGDRLVQPELALTLKLIAIHGPNAFYDGDIAAKIVAAMKKHDGLINKDDLKNYSAKIRPAVSGNVAGHTVYGAPLPSSGGITVLMQLRMIETLGLKKVTGEIWTLDQIHLMSEVMRRGFRERAAFLGDAEFVAIPEKLTSIKHASQLADSINHNHASSSREIAGDIKITKGPYESPETTHFSVIDVNGMAVSNTYTLEARFGARFIPEGTGMVLNNEMGDFNRYPGYTNTNGTIGTPANLVATGKRMLSSQSPTIVKRDGKVRFLVGSPGGRTIINTVTEILTQTLIFERTLEDAVNAPRFHHGWFPDEIKLEDDPYFSPYLVDLKKRGHKVSQPKDWSQGSAQCISFDPRTGIATGVADRRRGGAVRAVNVRDQE